MSLKFVPLMQKCYLVCPDNICCETRVPLFSEVPLLDLVLTLRGLSMILSFLSSFALEFIIVISLLNKNLLFTSSIFSIYELQCLDIICSSVTFFLSLCFSNAEKRPPPCVIPGVIRCLRSVIRGELINVGGSPVTTLSFFNLNTCYCC